MNFRRIHTLAMLEWNKRCIFLSNTLDISLLKFAVIVLSPVFRVLRVLECTLHFEIRYEVMPTQETSFISDST